MIASKFYSREFLARQINRERNRDLDDIKLVHLRHLKLVHLIHLLNNWRYRI